MPLVDTTNFVSADFRSIFGFYRSNWNGVNPASLQEYYEAWAVGTYPDPNYGADAGAFYRWGYNSLTSKYQWEQVLPGAALGQPPFTAIGGQYDFGAGYSEMWLANFDGTAAKIIGTQGTGAETDVPDIAAGLVGLAGESAILPDAGTNLDADCPDVVNSSCQGGMYAGRQCLRNNDAECPTTLPLSKPIYSIGAVQNFGGWAVAGGQDRQLLLHSSSAVGGCGIGGCGECDNINPPGTGTGNCRINTGTACTNLNKADVCYKNPIPDRWRDHSATLAGVSGFDAVDDITGITYVNNDTAYVTTTNFPSGTHPYDRTCPSGLIGKLFRVKGNPASSGSWKKVAEKTDTCWFGVAAGAVDTVGDGNGPLRNYVWIAGGSATPANRGIYRILDRDLTAGLVSNPVPVWPTTLNNIFAVSATRNINGDDANQLMNGEFNAWQLKSPSGNLVDPDGWTAVGQNDLERRGTGGSISCSAGNAADDITIVDGGPSGGGTADGSGFTPDFAIKIEPGQRMASCGGGTSTIDRRIAAATDDAEQTAPTGTANTSSSDMDLVYNGTNNQFVGLRFTGMTIPPGSTITNAYVQFRAAATESGTPVNLTIQGQLIGDAPTFSASSNNISSRTRTLASVTWNPPAWTNGTNNNPTSNISTVIQEIVNGAGWTGSATSDLVLIISGSGTLARHAPSFETDSANAALLHVDYQTGTATEIDKATNAVGATYVYNRVPLSGIEGKRYRVTGKYKVEFTGTGEASESMPTVTPPNAFGGVDIACAGANPPNSRVDCTMGNTNFLRNFNNPTTTKGSCDIDGGPNGFGCIDTIISRQDTQLVAPLEGAPSGNTSSGLILEIRCIGTYGTRVTCDDLHVEEVNSLPVSPSGSYLVAAVGQGGVALVSTDGASTGTPTFVSENNPVGGFDATAVAAVDPNHVFAVGLQTTVSQRSAGSVSGSLWAGTVSTFPAGAGWISMNCANHKNAGNLSLCQRSDNTFGVNFDEGASNKFSGRAWFGKLANAPVADQESINLGACVGAARKTLGTGDNPYDISDSCNKTTAIVAGTPPRACFGNSSKVCFSDFDCYGRCAGDSSYLCLYNDDCHTGTGSPPGSSNPSFGGTRLTTLPKNRLQCDLAGTNSSSLACTSAGWLTFNPAEFSPLTPPAEVQAALGQRNYCLGGGVCYDDATNKVKGVAQFTTLATSSALNNDPTKSWVSFRGASGTVNGTLFGCKACGIAAGNLNCKFCQDESNQSCVPLSNNPNPLPLADPLYPYTCHLYCDGDATSKKCINNSECPSNVCRAAGYCNRSPLTSCTSDANCAGLGGSCIFGAVCNPAGAQCDKYGVNYDDSAKKFRGYAWNPVYGWLDASQVQQGSAKFIQTRLGDVYATGQIGAQDINQAPQSVCNATYLISSASDIVQFCSNFQTGIASGDQLQSRVTQIPFISPSNLFSNILGRFDLVGMTTPAKESGGVKFNKYGSTLETLTTTGQDIDPFPDASGTNVPLKGKVFTVGSAATPGSYNFAPSQALSFLDYCVAPVVNGGGLVVVYGDLKILNNLSYTRCGTLLDLRGLASLVVVVTGNLTIENDVTNLVGTYYVQGTVTTAHDISGATDPNKYPLTVRGLMIAKDFTFGRKFAGTIDSPLPSELIILDGRVQSNPLPGMTDFASALPQTVNTGP